MRLSDPLPDGPSLMDLMDTRKRAPRPRPRVKPKGKRRTTYQVTRDGRPMTYARNRAEHFAIMDRRAKT